MYNELRGVSMGFYNKLKSKVFPDEKEVLYYSSDEKIEQEGQSRTYTINANNTFYSPSSFAQTRILSDKLKAGNVITIDVSNMEKKEALRMIDFLGGVMYALDGDMKKISKNIFEFSIPNTKK
jgi:cell division inhibitor SepF